MQGIPKVRYCTIYIVYNERYMWYRHTHIGIVGSLIRIFGARKAGKVNDTQSKKGQFRYRSSDQHISQR